MFKNITKFSQSLWPFVFPNPGSIIKKRAPYRFLPQIEPLEDRWNPSVGPSLFLDTNDRSLGSQPILLGQNENHLFFSADDGIHGRELWRTDGSPQGTILLADARPGNKSSNISASTPLGGNFYFVVDDPIYEEGKSLWKSDGTPSGTVKIKSLYDWKDSRIIINDIIPFKDKIYFFATNSRYDTIMLWSSDGTTEGTKIFKEFPYSHIYSTNIFPFDDYFYFSTGDGIFWRSNGEPDGTKAIYQFDALDINGPRKVGDSLIFPASESRYQGEIWAIRDDWDVPRLLVNSNPDPIANTPPKIIAVSDTSAIFTGFSDGNSSKTAIWQTDGTPEGTVQLPYLVSDFPDFRNPSGSIFFKGSFYFIVDDINSGMNLLKFDGTLEGTQLIPGLHAKTLEYLRIIDDSLYFYASQNEMELWKSDGTQEGTQKVISGTSKMNVRLGLKTFRGSLYFPWENDKIGPELWKSNGATNEYQPLTIIQKITNESGNPHSFFEFHDSFLLWASDHFSDQKLYSIQENQYTNLIHFELGSQVSSFALMGDRVWFLVTDSEGTTLWKTDGTPNGTTRVAIIGKIRGAGPGWIVPFKGMLMFGADDGIHGSELWLTDGTESGTVLLKDIFLGPNSGIELSTQPEVGNGLVYFLANDGIHGNEMWRSDGTESGTALIKDLNPGEEGTWISEFTAAGKYLFIFTGDPNSNYFLWQSDGSSPGTVMLASSDYANLDTPFKNPLSLGRIGDAFFFSADDRPDHFASWRIDGKTGRIEKFLDYIGPIHYNPGFIPFHGKYIFLDGSYDYNAEIFITDGTIKNTLNLGISYFGYPIFDYCISGNYLYFIGRFGLCRTDGTPDGTVLIKDLNFYESDLTDYRLFGTNNHAYFFIWNRFSKLTKPGIDTLWTSDGTIAGTKKLNEFPNLEGGLFGYEGYRMDSAVLGKTLFFMANDGFHGNELWKLDSGSGATFSQLPLNGIQGAFDSNLDPSYWQTVYIKGLYRTIFNRAATREEIRHWVGLMINGYSTERIARSFLDSREYRGIQVDSYYQKFLGRTPESREREIWVRHLIMGIPESEIIHAFFSSPEYLAKWVTPASFIEGVYQDLLGRQPSNAETRHWESLIQGGLSKSQVLSKIIHSEEATFNEIQSLYNNFLHRNIDSEGKVMVKRVIQQKSSLREVLQTIFSSPEFHQLSVQNW